MKKLLYTTLAISLLFIACKSEKKQEQVKEVTKEVKKAATTNAVELTHTVDIQNSKVLWTGFKPTGSHNGTINIKSGNASLKDGNLDNISIEIDMFSIKNLDMPADDPYNKKLVTHLISPDFFDVTQFSTATFNTTKIESDKEGQLQLTGDITIKGITKSISFPATIKQEANVIHFKAKAFKIDRTDFGIKYKSKNFFDNLKDKFINDEFEISFDITLLNK